MRRLVSLAIVFLAGVAIALTASGCTHPGPDPVGSAAYPSPPEAPEPVDLLQPVAATRSYLDWVSYAYRCADSDLAMQVMTPSERVRVDAYIELNRQQGRAIEQQLTAFEQCALWVKDSTATLTAHEEWVYRYISMESGYYSSGELTASYEATYTLVLDDGSWLVDRVEAEALTPVE